MARWKATKKSVIVIGESEFAPRSTETTVCEEKPLVPLGGLTTRRFRDHIPYGLVELSFCLFHISIGGGR